ncbi:hypothetical protein ABRQ00_04450 [Pectobacterium aroidearum]|nr:hypothetical protein [Pectobacterium zantedeschiae]
MRTVYKLFQDQNGNDSGVFLGGGALGENWPKNPLGENLKLLLTIDNNVFNERFGEFGLPNGKFTSVFSTYSDDRYFLDDVVYFGDSVEFDYIRKGFTRILFTDEPFLKDCEGDGKKSFCLKSYELQDDAFPAFSFFSNKLPNGLNGCEKLLSEYRFIGQIYSSDIPSKDGGALGLSDAVGYIFINKCISDDNDAGFFFVQTA